MNGHTGSNILIFIINVLFNLYLLAVLLRFLLQWVKADFYHPICQFTMRLTNPLIKPLRRIIPGFMGLDWACLVLMLIVQGVNLVLVALILGLPLSLGLITVAVIKIILLFLNVYFYAIIASAILSWLPQMQHSELYLLLQRLVYPVLRPIRRILPLIAGLDLSPLVALIIIQVIIMAVTGMMF